MYGWLDRRHRRVDWLETFTVGERAAATVGDMRGQAAMLSSLAACLHYLGREEEATTMLQRVLLVRRQVAEVRPLAVALLNLGNQYAEAGRDSEAIAHLSEALTLLRESDPQGPSITGQAFNNLGWAHYRAGRLDEAIDCYRHAVTIARELDNPQGVAFAESNLALAYADQQRTAEALAHWQHAVEAARQAGDLLQEAASLAGAAKARIALGDPAAAIPELRQALRIYQQLEHAEADAVHDMLSTISIGE
jgi:tetratricopeptide (TPR) repeat protein